jgi:hypothetical protein
MILSQSYLSRVQKYEDFREWAMGKSCKVFFYFLIFHNLFRIAIYVFLFPNSPH